MSRLSEYLHFSRKMRNSDGQSCLWSELLPSCGRLMRISFPSLLEIDKFCGFPAFPLLFWHERFLLCQILHPQVDLKKETISILLHVFDGI